MPGGQKNNVGLRFARGGYPELTLWFLLFSNTFLLAWLYNEDNVVILAPNCVIGGKVMYL